MDPISDCYSFSQLVSPFGASKMDRNLLMSERERERETRQIIAFSIAANKRCKHLGRSSSSKRLAWRCPTPRIWELADSDSE